MAEVDSHTTVKALTATTAKDGAGTRSTIRSGCFDGQSVGPVVKVKADNLMQQWRMYATVSQDDRGATKAGKGDTATQQWMDGHCCLDGKATLAFWDRRGDRVGRGIPIVPSVSDDPPRFEDALETPDTDLPAPRTLPNVEPDTPVG